MEVFWKMVRSDDVSNKTVLTVLFILILVSVVSMGLYLSKVDDARPIIKKSAEGKVMFEIAGPKQVVPAPTDVASGKVSLEIVEPMKEKKMADVKEGMSLEVK